MNLKLKFIHFIEKWSKNTEVNVNNVYFSKFTKDNNVDIICKYELVNLIVFSWILESDKQETVKFIQKLVNVYQSGYVDDRLSKGIDFYVSIMGIRNFMIYLCNKREEFYRLKQINKTDVYFSKLEDFRETFLK